MQNQKIISLTFDDALLNTYSVAFPILRKYGVKVTLFVPTGILTGELTPEFRLNDKSPLMNKNQIEELYRVGWEIGSHSHTHTIFRDLSSEKVEWELQKSKELLEEFNPVSFAFPGGHGLYSLRDIELARKYYRWVCDVSWQASVNYQTGLIRAYPVDDYPVGLDLEVQDWHVTCHHRVLDSALFEKFIQELVTRDFKFVRLRDRIDRIVG